MLNYLNSGVNLLEADSFVKLISKAAQQTFNENVLGGIGSFAGFFRLPTGYSKPVLVACTDGVGSKLKIAYENKMLDTVGQDLVAMCVNDLICCGAKPLFFLDYLATDELKAEDAIKIAGKIADCCKDNDCVLLGGETAELPGMLKPSSYELAGFAVGIVDEDKMLGPSKVNDGDYLIALPSSGLHSNGYSLVRSVLKKFAFNLNECYSGSSKTLLEELLEPTLIYANVVQKVSEYVNSIAHITGGGLIENLPRALRKEQSALIKKGSWPITEIFEFLQRAGEIQEDEMYKVFNMGVGMVLVVSEENKIKVEKILTENGQSFYTIGNVVKKATDNSPALNWG
jgi:phosphoribosylformylglycinamidine cyclo-ligase